MNNFMESLREETNFTTTLNDALTHISTLNNVLDFFALGGTFKNNPNAFLDMFIKAWSEDRVLATKVLFYMRDIRGGQGVRQGFRKALSYILSQVDSNIFHKKLLSAIPEYGRWDDVVYMIDNTNVALDIILEQLTKDIADYYLNKPISLLAKWMKSENTSSKDSKRIAKKTRTYLKMCPKLYRTTLSMLRKYIDVTEIKLSSNNIDKIEYSKVPSRAMNIYKDTFIRKDEHRYKQYIKDVFEGKTKINSSTLYPYEIIHQILIADDAAKKVKEAQWNALPNYINNSENSIAVVDVSGSMTTSGYNYAPLDVAISLGLYFAERSKGAFKDYFITFSAKPQLVKIIGNNLYEKVLNISTANWDQNTNIQAVFDLILNKAIKDNVQQKELPSKIYIISDMEFDVCSREKTNFQVIREKYERSGYTMPKLVFWNVDAKTQQVPVTQNQDGVYLVSGCSPSILKYAINAESTTPYSFMLETINSERYQILNSLFS